METADGLVFDPKWVSVDEIREAQEYGGFRIRLRAYLEKAWVNVQVDVGFGDAISPEVVEVECPSLLGFPAAKLRAYPRDTVIAEKLEAMVRLGLINSRMKDFSDLYYLCAKFSFGGRALCEAVRSTFARRRTAIPGSVPVALTQRFYGDEANARRWTGFLATARIDSSLSIKDACLSLAAFVAPVLEAASSGNEFDLIWDAGGPWHS